MTRIVRDRPYFDAPKRRGRWLTSTSAIRTPCSLAIAGTKRCISPYRRSERTTSPRNTLREQP